MNARRAGTALSVLVFLLSTLPGGGVIARAQVEDAEERVDETGAEVERAYQVVEETQADRDAVEEELFETLERYRMAGEEVVAASDDLARIADSLAFADASALEVERSLEVQAVTAYVEAVSASPSIVLSSKSVEGAIVVDELFRAGRNDTLEQLDHLVVMRRELELLRQRYAEELALVESLRADLDARSDDLESVLARANRQVAAAFEQARASDVRYRAALDDLAAAEAREEARRREEAARRAAATSTTTSTIPPTTATTVTTTTTPATTATTEPSETGASTTTTSTTSTTSTTVPDGEPAVPISARVMEWLPLLERHFAADLVSDSLVIMQCESLGDPDAVNPWSGAAGLYQFMPGTWAVASVQAGVGDRSVFDGEANIIAASWLAEYYRARGYDPWRPWSCRKYL